MGVACLRTLRAARDHPSSYSGSSASPTAPSLCVPALRQVYPYRSTFVPYIRPIYTYLTSHGYGDSLGAHYAHVKRCATTLAPREKCLGRLKNAELPKGVWIKCQSTLFLPMMSIGCSQGENMKRVSMCRISAT